jgi:hypothetical protein
MAEVDNLSGGVDSQQNVARLEILMALNSGVQQLDPVSNFE